MRLKGRRGLFAVVIAVAALATASGCSSPPAAPSKPSPITSPTYSPEEIKYVATLRAFPDPQFQPSQVSDAKLIAGGREVCAALATRTPADALTTLEHEGWSLDVGQMVVAGTIMLCSQYTNRVEAWEISRLNTASPAG